MDWITLRQRVFKDTEKAEGWPQGTERSGRWGTVMKEAEDSSQWAGKKTVHVGCSGSLSKIGFSRERVIQATVSHTAYRTNGWPLGFGGDWKSWQEQTGRREEEAQLKYIQESISGLPCWLSGGEFTCQRRRHRFHPWSERIPHAMQQLSPWTQLLSPCSAAREATTVRSLHSPPREEPLFTATKEKPAQGWRLSTAKNK